MGQFLGCSDRYNGIVSALYYMVTVYEYILCTVMVGVYTFKCDHIYVI
jgi:hypothetical protein